MTRTYLYSFLATLWMLWALVMLVLFSGCAFIEPATEISVNPFTKTVTVRSSKDDKLEVRDLVVTWGPEGGSLKLGSLVAAGQSSPVIEANVEQMLAFTEQQRAANEGIVGALESVSGMVNTMAGVVQALGDVIRGSSFQAGGVSGTLGVTGQPAEVEDE